MTIMTAGEFLENSTLKTIFCAQLYTLLVSNEYFCLILHLDALCRSWVGGVVRPSCRRGTVTGLDLKESLFHRKHRICRSYTTWQSTFPGCPTTYNGSRKSASYCCESVRRVCVLLTFVLITQIVAGELEHWTSLQPAYWISLGVCYVYQLKSVPFLAAFFVSTRSCSQHIDLQTVVEDSSFLCLSARLAH